MISCRQHAVTFLLLSFHWCSVLSNKRTKHFWSAFWLQGSDLMSRPLSVSVKPKLYSQTDTDIMDHVVVLLIPLSGVHLDDMLHSCAVDQDSFTKSDSQLKRGNIKGNTNTFPPATRPLSFSLFHALINRPVKYFHFCWHTLCSFPTLGNFPLRIVAHLTGSILLNYVVALVTKNLKACGWRCEVKAYNLYDNIYITWTLVNLCSLADIERIILQMHLCSFFHRTCSTATVNY